MAIKRLVLNFMLTTLTGVLSLLWVHIEFMLWEDCFKMCFTGKMPVQVQLTFRLTVYPAWQGKTNCPQDSDKIFSLSGFYRLTIDQPRYLLGRSYSEPTTRF